MSGVQEVPTLAGIRQYDSLPQGLGTQMRFIHEVLINWHSFLGFSSVYARMRACVCMCLICLSIFS